MANPSYKWFGIVGQYPKYITIEMVTNSKDGFYFFISKEPQPSIIENLKNNDIFRTIEVLNAH